MNIKKAKKETKEKNIITIDYENKRLSVFYFLPLLLIAGFVPLIVYAKYVDLSGTTQSLYWTGQQQYLDFFSYWKAQWVVALTAIALIFYIILYKQKKLPFKTLKQYYIPLGIYAVFVIISTIFAVDTQTALWGFVDMYQGMFVLLSYVAITFLTINFVNNERDVTLFVKAFIILIIIEGLLGLTQYFGFDFLQTRLGKSLIIPGGLKADVSFTFGPKTIYGTLFNTNYVGSFATLMLPLSIAFLLGAKTKKQRILSLIAVVLMIFTWIGSNSRAGYLGVAVSAVVGIFIFRELIKKHWKVTLAAIVASFLVLGAFNMYSNGLISERIKSFNLMKQIEYHKNINTNSTRFRDIELGKDTFSIKTTDEVLNFKIDDNKLFFLDENSKELEITTKDNEIKIKDPKYSGYKIILSENYPGITVYRGIYWDWMPINFYFSKDGVKLLGSGGRLIEPIIADRMELLDGLESIASNRGYIWGRSIPLINNNLIKGAGPDNYIYAFPQEDVVAKLNTGMEANMVIDKPHNLLIQTSINTGFISFISLAIIWIAYLLKSIKLYSMIKLKDTETLIGVSCFLSILGYLIAGIFNDQIVSVAPLFWIILGLGISINNRLERRVL